MTKKLGFSISVEGVDGCGKDTAIEMMRQALIGRGYDVVVHADLYSTDVGMGVRKIFIESETPPDDVATMLLVTAARREMLRRHVLPAIRAGRVVLLNRFKDSTVAYQGFAGDPSRNSTETVAERITVGQHLELTLESINRHAGVTYIPDHTLLLTIDPLVQQARLSGRNPAALDRYDAAGPTWHSLVQTGFEHRMAGDAQRFTVIDNSMLSMNAFTNAVTAYIDEIANLH